MNSIELLASTKIDFSIESRSFAKKLILENKIPAKEVMKLIETSEGRNQILYVAVLDYLIEDEPDYLKDDIQNFIAFLKTATNETSKRSGSRIVYHLLLSNIDYFNKKQKEALIQIHFDWLIQGSQVATRVNCISVLFILRNELPWIQTNLVAIIEQQIILKKPSFVSRAKKILKQIHKEANK